MKIKGFDIPKNMERNLYAFSNYVKDPKNKKDPLYSAKAYAKSIISYQTIRELQQAGIINDSEMSDMVTEYCY